VCGRNSAVTLKAAQEQNGEATERFVALAVLVFFGL
jgi:hypothetical protein